MPEHSIAFKIGGFSIHWYGIVIAAAVFLAIFLASRLSRYRGLKSDAIYDFALLAVPFGIVGARVYYVLFSLDYYIANPLDIFKIWNGGLAIYGAVLGGVAAAAIFAKIRKINLLALMDIGGMVLILAQAIGRWGNFFNQEAYGNLITNPKWQFFPLAVYIDAQEQWYQATFFYESMWNLLTFGLLLCIFFGVGFFGKINSRWEDRRNLGSDKPRMCMPAGTIGCAYFLLYGTGRALIEPLRSDSLMLGPFRVSFLLSCLMIIAAAFGLYGLRRWGKPAELCLADAKPTDELGDSEPAPKDLEGYESALEPTLAEAEAAVEPEMKADPEPSEKE